MLDPDDLNPTFGPGLAATLIDGWPLLPGTGSLDLAPVVDAALALAQTQLSHFLASADVLEVLRLPFGDGFDRDRATDLIQDWLTGDFQEFPTIALIPSEVLEGANAGFDALTGTVYLADRWLTGAFSEPAALVDILLEEVGHFMDAQINLVDAPGDEGAIFAAIVQQQGLSPEQLTALQLEDDTATIVIGDRTVTIEKSDNSDDTLLTARDLGTLSGTQAFSDFVGSTDQSDYYQFAIASPSNFSLVLNGMSANANVRLLNASGQQIVASTQTGITPDTINRILDAGTYFVQVLPVSSANTNYNLSLTAEALPPDGAGNTLNTARPLGVLNGTQSFYDAVDSLDNNDYYSFSVTNPISLNLVLGGMGANANLRLLNASGQQIVASNRSGIAIDSISRILDGGDYFIQVLPARGARTAYTLDVTATALPPDLAGNTLNTARDLGSLQGTQNFYDFVGGIDPNDYYRFTLDNGSNFNLVLDGMSGNANVRLLNANGQAIVASTQTGITPDTLNRSLVAGTYYVQVFPARGANTTYNLSLTADPGPPDGAGNTLGTARDLGTLSDTQTFTDFVGTLDPNDYYRFAIDSRSQFGLVLDGMSANANVRLLNASGQQIVASSNTGIIPDTINRILEVGTYYVQVLPASGVNTTYNLSLTALPTTSPPPAGGFNIQFDYRFDTNGFFNDPLRRSALEAAANLWTSIILDDFADIPVGTTLYVRNPETSNTMLTIASDTIIDDVMVFVGIAILSHL